MSLHSTFSPMNSLLLNQFVHAKQIHGKFIRQSHVLFVNMLPLRTGGNLTLISQPIEALNLWSTGQKVRHSHLLVRLYFTWQTGTAQPEGCVWSQVTPWIWTEFRNNRIHEFSLDLDWTGFLHGVNSRTQSQNFSFIPIPFIICHNFKLSIS